MSSIMRWRSGLMAVSVIEGSCREVEGPNPSILTTGPSPVIVCPSAGYRPKAIALPQPQCLPARAGSFLDANAEIEQTSASNRILLKLLNGDPEEPGTAVSVRVYP